MTRTTYGVGRATASIGDATVEPRIQPVTPLPLVVYCHAVGGNALEASTGGVSLPAMPALLRYLTRVGYYVVSATMPATWGNATSQTRLANLISWAKANLRVDSGAVHLIGTSHGAVNSLRWAADNPAGWRSWSGFVPVIDMDDVRAGDLGGLRAGIDAAHSVTYPAALPVGVNPASRSADVTGRPLRAWAASDDAIARPGPLATWAAATGATVTNVGALGHTDAAVAAIDPQALLAHIAAN